MRRNHDLTWKMMENLHKEICAYTKFYRKIPEHKNTMQAWISRNDMHVFVFSSGHRN